MVDFKFVIGAKDGKCYQREIKSPESENLLKKRIGDKVSGDNLGFNGYEFQITGGSDKCGFPMRKGIQIHRQKILLGEGVGFCGKKRKLRKKSTRKKQGGLVRRRTVCGEMITKIINQVNVKVIKEGNQKFGAEEGVEEKPAEGTSEAGDGSKASAEKVDVKEVTKEEKKEVKEADDKQQDKPKEKSGSSDEKKE
jgi:small subunit ribosomal protein S6e